jgi:hypothetical protein
MTDFIAGIEFDEVTSFKSLHPKLMNINRIPDKKILNNDLLIWSFLIQTEGNKHILSCIYELGKDNWLKKIMVGGIAHITNLANKISSTLAFIL